MHYSIVIASCCQSGHNMSMHLGSKACQIWGHNVVLSSWAPLGGQQKGSGIRKWVKKQLIFVKCQSDWSSACHHWCQYFSFSIEKLRIHFWHFPLVLCLEMCVPVQ